MYADPEAKRARDRARNRDPKRKAQFAKYHASVKGRLRARDYFHSVKGRTAKRRYWTSPKGRIVDNASKERARSRA